MSRLTLQLLADEELLGVGTRQIVAGSAGHVRKRKRRYKHYALHHDGCGLLTPTCRP